MDVPHTTGNHTPDLIMSQYKRPLDVPHTTGNHTPFSDYEPYELRLDVPHTTGNHTPYIRQMSDIHYYWYLPSGIIPQHKGIQLPQFE